MRATSMFITTIVMAILSVIAFYFAYRSGRHVEGLMISKNLLLQVTPLLVFAFILAGMAQVLIPAELIAKWIGEESGFKGIIIGSLVGGFLPGGPYVTLPIIVGLAKIGASVPVLVATITGWSLIALARLPMDIGILGPRLALIRLASTFMLAPLAGLLAQFIVKVLKI